MEDQTQTTNQVDKTLTTETTLEEKPKIDLPKHLRSVIENKEKENQKLKAELDAIKKAEEDKTKSAEQKAIELEQELKETKLRQAKEKALYTLEKQLLAENVNPEFSDLILAKAQGLVDPDLSNMETVLSELKTTYPSAFAAKEVKPEPIGKVGTSITTSSNSLKMTKEQVLKALNDPNKPLTKELKQLADEYGL